MGNKEDKKNLHLSVILYFFKEIWQNIHDFPFLLLDACTLYTVKKISIGNSWSISLLILYQYNYPAVETRVCVCVYVAV